MHACRRAKVSATSHFNESRERAAESASRLCVSALRQSNNSVQLERRVELTSTAWNSASFAAGYSRVRNSRLRVVSSRQIQRAYARARESDKRQRGERQALSVIVHAGYLHKIGTILFACRGECGAGKAGKAAFYPQCCNLHRVSPVLCTGILLNTRRRIKRDRRYIARGEMDIKIISLQICVPVNYTRNASPRSI